MMRNFFLLSIIILSSGCVTSERLRYAELNPVYGAEPKNVNLIINAYPLKTPGPTVIYAHGCSGLDGAYLDWKNKLNDWGYNVVQPDSMKSRGVKRACNEKERESVSNKDRLEDVIEASKWVQQQSWHSGKIGVIGYSMGGLAALNLASDGGEYYPYTDKVDQDIYVTKYVSAVIAFYPACKMSHREAKVPSLILIGELDTWTPVRRCDQLAALGNKNITLIKYPGAYHSFDTPGFNQVNGYGHMIKYNPQAAADAEMRTREFFEKYLKN